MNTYGRTLLKFLLGWLKDATESFDESSLLASGHTVGGWLGEHWLALTLLLLLVGVLLDFVIWLVRWKPYLVWGTKWKRFLSFFSRSSREERQFARGYREDNQAIKEVAESNGTEYEDNVWNDQRDRMVDWQFEAARQESYAASAADIQEAPQRRRRSDKYHKGLGGAVRNMRSRLYPDEDEEEYLVDGLEPIVSREDAFREPVYPQGERSRR